MTRDFCARCAIKHLAQARVLMQETKKGYPLHVYYAMGHMAEAEDELLERMPVEAGVVRDHRLKLEEALRDGTTYSPDWGRMMMLIAKEAMLEETQ